jgi:hypothetical protein
MGQLDSQVVHAPHRGLHAHAAHGRVGDRGRGRRAPRLELRGHLHLVQRRGDLGTPACLLTRERGRRVGCGCLKVFYSWPYRGFIQRKNVGDAKCAERAQTSKVRRERIRGRYAFSTTSASRDDAAPTHERRGTRRGDRYSARDPKPDKSFLLPPQSTSRKRSGERISLPSPPSPIPTGEWCVCVALFDSEVAPPGRSQHERTVIPWRPRASAQDSTWRASLPRLRGLLRFSQVNPTPTTTNSVCGVWLRCPAPGAWRASRYSNAGVSRFVVFASRLSSPRKRDEPTTLGATHLWMDGDERDFLVFLPKSGRSVDGIDDVFEVMSTPFFRCGIAISLRASV